jgi:hypothetical protein
MNRLNDDLLYGRAEMARRKLIADKIAWYEMIKRLKAETKNGNNANR